MPSPVSKRSGEQLRRHHRLLRRADFLRCYRSGRKRHGSLVSIHFYRTESSDVRLGITASRKVGNSVVRHLLKRRVREVFRRYKQRDRLLPVDVVIHLKPSAARAGFAELAAEIERLMGFLERPERRN